MALTADDIVEAVNAVPGVTKEAITRTLMVGGLTTGIDQIDDQIDKKKQALSDANAAAETEIAALNAQRAALLAQRQSLLQS